MDKIILNSHNLKILLVIVLKGLIKNPRVLIKFHQMNNNKIFKIRMIKKINKN